MWSVVVDNLVSHPRFGGPLEAATHEGVAGTPGEGPHLRLWLRVQGEQIAEARYHTYGCLAAIASGEMLCLLLNGRPLETARLLSAHDLTAALHGLPEGKEHCPRLAIEALHHALAGKTAASL